MNNKEKISKELENFCRNIEKWFRGETQDQKLLYETIMSGFSSDFSMLNGDGVSITLAMFSDWLPTVFGQFPDRSVQIEDVEIHYSNDHGLATFTEIQITGTVSNQRSSSAVFLLTQEKALWFHLIEKWI